MKKVCDIGTRIKEYRYIKDVTLADLEMATGIKAQTLNRYELGQRNPKIDTAIQIAEKLNINLLWLQGYDEDMEVPEAQDAELLALDTELAALLNSLTAEEWIKVDAFVRGLLASR